MQYVKRTVGKTAGATDRYFIAPDGTVLRSAEEMAAFVKRQRRRDA